ncbi:MAG: hypothetical protein BMS9Abin02_1251 [Anaerolineae bacterium]|nr:MAG: hypothetical protein BMS9Abin02_1251 [Anaerolineae bacterium]
MTIPAMTIPAMITPSMPNRNIQIRKAIIKNQGFGEHRRLIGKYFAATFQFAAFGYR